MHRHALSHRDRAEQHHARGPAVRALQSRLTGLQKPHRADEIELKVLAKIGWLQAAEGPQRDAAGAVDRPVDLLRKFRQRTVGIGEVARQMPNSGGVGQQIAARPRPDIDPLCSRGQQSDDLQADAVTPSRDNVGSGHDQLPPPAV